MATLQVPKYSSEEALGFILSYLRGNRSRQEPTDSTGMSYDVYIPNVMNFCAQEQRNQQRNKNPQGFMSFQTDVRTNAEPFYDAAWALCTRNILRPGIVYPSRQFEYAPIIGAGFSLTEYGKTWLQRASGFEALPVEYHRFSKLLAVFSPTFGNKFHLRSQEAVSCYQAHTYLACCVMCGAASESILLTLAIAKKGNEDEVLKEYRASQGRKKIENYFISQGNSIVVQEFPQFTNLLKYWRDDAAHGGDVSFSESEAFMSLITLLRFAQFAVDKWELLTGKPRAAAPSE